MRSDVVGWRYFLTGFLLLMRLIENRTNDRCRTGGLPRLPLSIISASVWLSLWLSASLSFSLHLLCFDLQQCICFSYAFICDFIWVRGRLCHCQHSLESIFVCLYKRHTVCQWLSFTPCAFFSMFTFEGMSLLVLHSMLTLLYVRLCIDSKFTLNL